MTVHMQHILQHLFRADTLEDVPRERLEALVEEYPSFSIARYLLSSKLRAEHADHFEEETRKTNLYFTNPFWLQWLLQQEAVDGGSGGHPAGEQVVDSPDRGYVEERIEEPAAIEEPVEQPVAEHWVEEPKPEYPAADHWQEQEHQAEQPAEAEQA